jgi:alpha-L-rhamnosidase
MRGRRRSSCASFAKGCIDTDPDHPGFARVLIHPRPGGGLTHARAIYHSIHGPIVSDWRTEGDEFVLAVELPANTGGTDILPAADPEAVTEGGVPAHRATGVEPIPSPGAGGRQTRFAVGSGSYLFRSRLPMALQSD